MTGTWSVTAILLKAISMVPRLGCVEEGAQKGAELGRSNQAPGCCYLRWHSYAPAEVCTLLC
jgi:hypothetical protein